MTRRTFVTVLLFALAALPALASDIDGKWTATIKTPDGVRHYIYEFHAQGSELNGTFNCAEQKSGDLQQGKIDGSTISFLEPQTDTHGRIDITYIGTVDGDKIHFTRKVGTFGTDQFVADRVK